MDQRFFSNEKANPTLLFVVDGNIDNAESLRLLLHSAGWRVRAFTSAADCVTALQQERPICIIADWQLPDLNREDLRQALMAQLTVTPVVVMSSVGEIACEEGIRPAGICELLLKPFSADTLKAAVYRAVLAHAHSCIEVDEECLPDALPDVCQGGQESDASQ